MSPELSALVCGPHTLPVMCSTKLWLFAMMLSPIIVIGLGLAIVAILDETRHTRRPRRDRR